mmetsp:Transcript_22712/g.31731  ORF Transcript_22712/g.31731 Transcript_22712/m.31731 type:complete len:487 (+) Transcript_22712:266-1726(+)|eukprot:CAMPEP_0184491194 /NCGR_PEP_ID=MMETSP0113_2-20130426/19802_1 /TAXON_ID=91329 /ORGANISM="Norrisiella sphaerica, Strain BC52" /LENGTH=486 /DNA_ID=CAMNT_0026875459 /DNA_START=259 /DNA_END=1719 /DNA_ORIENTATION=+
MSKKKGDRCNVGQFLGCWVSDQIKVVEQEKRIQELRRQREELRDKLAELTPPGTPGAFSGGARRRRTRIGGDNLARPNRGDAKGRTTASLGGSMDETGKLQGQLELIKEQQKLQKQTHASYAKKKEEELKAKDLEIRHLRERVEKMEEEQTGLREKANRAELHSDQMESMRARVLALEKELQAKDQKVRMLETNPQKFNDLQKYVHEELTRHVETAVRMLEATKKSQTEAFRIISELRKAIMIEISQKVESIGKNLEASAEENDAWSNRIGQQDQQLQKLKKELRELRNQAHKLEVSFEAYKQQQSLQMLQGDSSSIGSSLSPQQKAAANGTQNGSLGDHKALPVNKLNLMKSDMARVDAGAIAKQAQVDSMLENNAFMKKELTRRSQNTDSSITEVMTISRKNSNAISFLNEAERRFQETQSRIDDTIEPGVRRAGKLVGNVSEAMHQPDSVDVNHLSRSSPGFGERPSSWLQSFGLENIKFTWD